MKTAPLLAGLVIATATLGARSADEPKADREADARAIQKADQAFVDAFNKGDAKAIAALFAEDGEVILKEGAPIRGRAAIEKHFASELAEGAGGKLEITADPVRFLDREVAIVEGKATLKPSEVGAPPESGRFTVLYVRRDGKWLQALVRDEADDEVALTPHDRLKELEWMLGEWVSESDEAHVETTCAWADNKNFLVRSFTVKVAGRPAMTGSQRIGWDPLTKGFKSWVFDSEGGHAEALWSREGDRWVVKSTGVLADGRTVSATNIIVQEGKDRSRWSSTDRTVGGEASADVEEILLVRKPPQPK